MSTSTTRRPVRLAAKVALATLGFTGAFTAVAPSVHANGTSAISGATVFSDSTVTMTGTSAISGATVFSDSTVTPARGSSSVVSLGKLGRVE